MYCPKCGARNDEDARFCVKCRADLAAARGAVPPRRELSAGTSRLSSRGRLASSTTWRLVVPGLAVLAILLGGWWALARSASSPVAVPEPVANVAPTGAPLSPTAMPYPAPAATQARLPSVAVAVPTSPATEHPLAPNQAPVPSSQPLGAGPTRVIPVNLRESLEATTWTLIEVAIGPTSTRFHVGIRNDGGLGRLQLDLSESAAFAFTPAELSEFQTLDKAGGDVTTVGSKYPAYLSQTAGRPAALSEGESWEGWLVTGRMKDDAVAAILRVGPLIPERPAASGTWKNKYRLFWLSYTDNYPYVDLTGGN